MKLKNKINKNNWYMYNEIIHFQNTIQTLLPHTIQKSKNMNNAKYVYNLQSTISTTYKKLDIFC